MFSPGQRVVTDDGDEGTVTDLYRLLPFEGNAEARDYVAIYLGGGCVIEAPVEQVRAM